MRSVKIVTAIALASFLACTVLAQAQSGRVAGVAQTGSIGAGRFISIPSSTNSYSPTAEQIAIHERLLAAKSMHLAPALGPHATMADVAPVASGPATEVTDAAVQPPAATTFTVFKQKLINAVCPECAQSTVNEPSAANSGKNIMETSNWNLAYALNGGAATPLWHYQDPYVLSPGYCCDTQVIYDHDRDIFILMLLDYAGEGASTNGLTISIARGAFPSTGPSWCTYKFTGASFGEGGTDTLDFPKIAESNSNLFLTWNDYPPSAGFRASGLARMPLDSLASCSGFSYNYLTRNTEFTFALAQQASSHDQFYWVSNWFLDGTTSGQNLRIFTWADGSGTYFANTRAVNAYTFGTAACPWCGRLDPRYESVVIFPAEYRAQANSAFAGDDVLEVATTAGPSGFSGGQNYVVYNYFKLHSLTYIGNDQTYNPSFSFGYPGCAVSTKGYVGCAETQGTAPGGMIILQDNVNPTQPWGVDFAVGGISVPAGNAWGDYNVTNPWNPGGDMFQTVLWNVNGSTVQPYYIVWGRGSEANEYARWKTK